MENIKLPSGQTLYRWADGKSGEDELFIADFMSAVTRDGSKIVATIPLGYGKDGILENLYLITE